MRDVVLVQLLSTQRWDNCALFENSRTFSAQLVHAIIVSFRYGGKSDLTSEGCERSNSI